MSKLFRSLCSELGIQTVSTTSYQPQGNAMIERTNWTIEECLSKYIGPYQHEWTKILHLAMMAYRSSIHSVTKDSPTHVVPDYSLSLFLDCMYNTPQIAVFETPSDYVFTMKEELQETHQMMRKPMDVEKESPIMIALGIDRAIKLEKIVFFFNPTAAKGEKRKLTFFYRGPHTIVEIVNHLKFKVEDTKTRKAVKVHYGRLKKFKTREKAFTPEPQAERKATVKEQKNTNLNSSDYDYKSEKESSTDSGSNLNTENQSDSKNSLNVTNGMSENEAKESKQKILEGKKRQTKCRGRRCNYFKPTEYTGKEVAETKNQKTEKKPQESSSKTKTTEENTNSDPKAPKMAKKSRSRLKSVSDILKNCFTEQDEEYFISQETDDVFVSGKSRKK